MSKKKAIQSSRTSTGAASRIYSRDNVGRYSERARQRRRGKHVRRVVLCTVLGVFIAAAAAAGMWLNNVSSKLNNSSVITSALQKVLVDSNVARDPFYMLLLGTDGRPGDTTYRSDSIILVRCDPNKKVVTLVSIPRDSKVTYKGSIYKITETHAIGGSEAVVECVNELCGVKISHYAEINFDGMKQLVDSVGGIDINVPEGDEVDDPEAGPVKIEAGQQHMDGEAALTFCRARHQFQDGDYTRMRHQRMVLGALANQILNNLDVTKIPSLVESLSSMVATDLNVQDIVSLVNAMKGMDTNSMYSCNLPSHAGADTYIDGKSYVFVDEEKTKEIMARVDAGVDPQGPQSQGDTATTGGTVADLSNNTNESWYQGTATVTESDSSSDGSSADSSSSN